MPPTVQLGHFCSDALPIVFLGAGQGCVGIATPFTVLHGAGGALHNVRFWTSAAGPPVGDPRQREYQSVLLASIGL